MYYLLLTHDLYLSSVPGTKEQLRVLREGGIVRKIMSSRSVLVSKVSGQ